MNRIKKSFLITIFFTSLLSPVSYANDVDGLIRIKSPHSVHDTISKFEAILNKKGMTIFKRISHSNGAAKVGIKLRDTELLIFGNPKVGTPLMLCQQTLALDLPQKALAYKDATGQVWLAYNDPAYIAKRHHVTGCEAALKKVSNALAALSQAAVK